MPISVSSMLGLQTRFKVTVDGVNLGGWSKCTGLTVEFKNKLIKEGGNYEYQPILADYIEYKQFLLERAMNAEDSSRVQGWLRSKVSGWMNAQKSGGGGTAQITLLDSHLNPVASWSLRNVYPAKWDGPELSVATFGVAIEKLTLAHEGFL
jgi:phage tail-like protein